MAEARKLRRTFLPEIFDPLGVYPDQQRVQTHARAYVVLCHAEIETFIEAWAKELARKSEEVWKRSGRVCAPLAHLLAASSNRLKVSTSKGAVDGCAGVRFKEQVARILGDYYAVIAENHGVKEENCLRLLGALGIEYAAFGATLLPSLDSFGKLRGEQAHHAARMIVTPLDPGLEYTRMNSLLDELGLLDKHLMTFKRSVR